MGIDVDSRGSREHALQLREYVKTFLKKVECDKSTIYVPLPKGRWTKKQESPFHLRTEIFLQISGECIFDFPAQRIVIGPGVRAHQLED